MSHGGYEPTFQEETHINIDRFWELCLAFEYVREELVAGLEAFLNRLKPKTILDCACGTGFVSLDLIQKGYPITCSDGSERMLRLFKQNAEKMGVDVTPLKYQWSELGDAMPNQFDLVMCRGSSLIYARAWDESRENNSDTILNALENFYSCLCPGGTLYVDTTAQENLDLDGPQQIAYPVSYINGKRVRFVDKITNVKHLKLRIWEPTLYINDSVYRLRRYSYLLTHEELHEFLKHCGFEDIEKIPILGEHYAVFTARKP